MTGSLNEIKNKIASTKKTSQITGAMQMVSAAKLAKSEQAAKSFQIYADKVRHITTDLLRSELLKGSTNPMLIRREEIKKTGYIVITSDSGLKGAYNSTILKAVMGMIDQDHTGKNEFEIIAIGGIGADFFKNRGMAPIYELRGIADNPNFEEVQKIIYKSVEMYKNEIFDELYVCYNHHVNSLTSQVRVQQMLPIEDLDHNEAEGYTASFELEPNRTAIVEQLLPQYAETMIYGALLDAKTAESAAGMTAMQTATDNARNVISDLTIQYNRARQAAITQEITEIVAGASALD